MFIKLRKQPTKINAKPPFVTDGQSQRLSRLFPRAKAHLDAVRAFSYRGQEFLVTIVTLVHFVS